VEVEATVHLRSAPPREEAQGWAELLRRQRAWLFGEAPRTGPLDLGVPVEGREGRWLSALAGKLPVPLDDVAFGGPIGPLEARGLAVRGECREVTSALPWFWQLLIPGMESNLGLVRAAAMGADMAQALRLCHEPNRAGIVEGRVHAWRAELATLLARASADRAPDALLFDADSTAAWRAIAAAACRSEDRSKEREALLELVALSPWDLRAVARLTAIEGISPDRATQAVLERARPYLEGGAPSEGAGCLAP
jgi:hypothetical protein